MGEEGGNRAEDLIIIGQLHEGQERPRGKLTGPGWYDITRDRSAPQPYGPKTDSWAQPDTTLWVGIASFRDSRCGQTLFNLFNKAKFPDRISVGVVQQNEEGDSGCLEDYCGLYGLEKDHFFCPHKDRIRVLELDAKDAQGPCWGRHMQSYLLADEEFCMQTDSHMDFSQDWDESMMKEWSATRNEYGVLSTYVQGTPGFDQNVNGNWEVAHLCEVFFLQNQPRNQQARGIHQMTEPKMTTTWAAGYSFSKCHAERAVPYDPYLDQIFDGEEFSKMLRLWTNGYDVYTPSRSYIGHDYGHTDPKRQSWRRTPSAEAKQKAKTANQRLWDLMEMPGSTEEGSREVQAGPWGLGDRRTLDDFIKFTGVNLREKSWIGTTGDRCGSGVEWVPFDLPADDVPQPGAAQSAWWRRVVHFFGRDNKPKPEPLEDKESSADADDDDDADDVADKFESWKTRQKTDPIVEGPKWAEVKQRLEESGVDVWWDPRHHLVQEAPPARDPPHLGEEESSDDGSEDEGNGDVAQVTVDVDDGVADLEAVGDRVGEGKPAESDRVVSLRAGGSTRNASGEGGSWGLALLLSLLVVVFVLRRRAREGASGKGGKSQRHGGEMSGAKGSLHGVTAYMWEAGGRAADGDRRKVR